MERMTFIDFLRKLERGSISFLFSKEEIDPIMGKEAFEQRLREFFENYDEKQLKLVPKIANKLHAHEELIMNHLHKKYETGKARNVSEEELKEEDRERRQNEKGASEEQASSEAESAPEEEEEGEADTEKQDGEESEESEEEEEKKE